MPDDAAGAVTLHVWRVGARDVPRTVVSARRTAARARRRGEATFTKVLGTSSAAFLPTAATPTRWALLTCWAGAARPVAPPVAPREAATLSLRPLWVRGRWDGHQLDAGRSGDEADEGGWTGRVVVLTRATLRPGKALRFYRAVPPVAASLRAATGCRAAFGVGEAPLLRQGTVSVWDSAAEMREFASGPRHLAAVRATPDERWYAEELFARFALLEASGTIDGVAVS